MSRRRSTNPTKAISITLKSSTIKKLDDVLDWKQSRSKYIQDAIEKKLMASEEIQFWESTDILYELWNRNVIGKKLLATLLNSISEDA
tara:strand:+ start:69 stop:332 length:264 start_codon:yes stop_codon:yes gene_type:complete